ncbi:hypothetical protein PITCH_A90002 [uncultured Desulfobacterium sp.]|uniref:FAD/NAD(P)-binding domain-containing protein n=1 Tax=uncultured Desulfobacterium sp. TaxID=201089 RepID=A0A445N3S0_9BACT|nr:hypothetical protein PITCH_A90002 [uncultured Desulfobacterium sp.]
MRQKIKPDVIVLATGGILATPDISGIDLHHVLKSSDLHKKIKSWQRFLGPNALRRLTHLWMPIGKRVIIIGGAMQGCELAEFLTLRGRKVIIVEQAEHIGEGLGSEKMFRLFKWMKIRGVKMVPAVKEYKAITEEGLKIIDWQGKENVIYADTIITVTPFISDTDLLKRIEGKVSEVYCIGDCREPGLIAYAIADGAKVARKI